jgi:hypothetical protein
MNVKEIVIEYLKANKYDGLSDGDGCGCGIDDLMKCGEINITNCKPAFKKKCTDKCYKKSIACPFDCCYEIKK